ncbi:hypothetical protein POM88_034005 [Heracleum sosnowskyi]|uniref:Uncharacterized protein n=1 Tax=Heracleum sosnowskyi TaxID=360622 RepID=A0AAD8HJK7_9APIA|nr:hypothetical protein POM88_034005 [Heracleum sosnowskyi]
MLEYTFTKRFFQIYSSFGQYIKIYAPSSVFPEWISKPADWFSQSSNLGTRVCISNLGTRVCLELPPNVSHNYVGMILCFQHSGDKNCQSVFYSIETTTDDFVWIDGGDFSSSDDYYHISRMDIVSKSIFSVIDGDHRIEFSAARKINLYNATSERTESTENAEILGIHLLYRTECTMIDECNNSTVNVEDERSYPL